MTQAYTFGLLAALFFGGGYQVATWQANSKLYHQQIQMEKQALEWGQEAAILIEEAQQENTGIEYKWRTRYEKIYIRDNDGTTCLDADQLWDWNDANRAASKQAFIFDDTIDVIEED